MKLSLISLLSIAPLATAHFKLLYPSSRGFDESTMPEFPCGGFSPSATRTKLPLSGGSIPVAIAKYHVQTAVEFLLALGNSPGDNFNITLVPTFQVDGLGNFCLPHVAIDEKVLGTPLTDGMNATLQVQTNGDTGGGLYACADVEFSSTVTYSEPSSCKNNTNIQASPFTGAAALRNANESSPQGQPQGGSTGGGTTTGGAVPLQTGAWGVLGAAVIGAVALL